MPFDVDFDTVIKLVSPIVVAIVGAMVKQIVEGKPRLVLYLVHASEHPLPPPAAPPATPQLEGSVNLEQAATPPVQIGPRVAHSHAIVVRNTGKKSAHNVRIDHEIFPFSYRVWPPLNHTVNYGQDGRAEIFIPVIVQTSR